MSAPKVSVILPVFNAESYLNEAIESVLAQSYADYEFLIWNDGSTDNSMRIIESKKDDRIRVFKNDTNRGSFKTLNKLIEQTRGEFIHIWCGDDVMRPYCLAEEMRFYEKHRDVGFCYSQPDRIDGTGSLITKAAQNERLFDIIAPERAVQMFFYYGSIPGNISNVMIKKSVFEIVGLFREDMRAAADFEMWARISEKHSIGLIYKPLVMLRFHKGQLSLQKGMGLEFIREYREIISKLIERLPPELIPYAKAYNRWTRYPQYAHYMLRCFISGEFKIAIETYHQIAKLDNPFLIMGLWFVTANGRFFKKRPKFIKA